MLDNSIPHSAGAAGLHWPTASIGRWLTIYPPILNCFSGEPLPVSSAVVRPGCVLKRV